MNSAEVRELTALVASAWLPSTSTQDIIAAEERFYSIQGPDPTQDDSRKRVRVFMETAIEVRLAFHLARCLAETSWSSVTREHLATECSYSGLTKARGVARMITMMNNMVTVSERLPDIQSVLEQVSPGCRAVWCHCTVPELRHWRVKWRRGMGEGRWE